MKDVLEIAWADSTRETYGAGLRVYHIFCNCKGISEEKRAPTIPLLIVAFISTIAGAYSGKSANNYVFGIQAWHVLHGIDWKIDGLELKALLKAADKAAPALSQRPKCTPYTIEFMLAI